MTLDEALAECPLVAIVRGVRPDEVSDHAEALCAAGVRGIEVPLNSPDAFKSIAALAGGLQQDCLVGAGTVLHAADVHRAHSAGGRLVVKMKPAA